MANTIPKENIIAGNVIEPTDITNIVNGLDGTTGYDIVMTATLRQGLNTSASGSYSHAEGDTTIASGSYSHAEGRTTQAKGNWSHAEGTGTIASGSYSHAEGNSTQAIGASSHAEGSGTKSIGLYSHAEGRGTQAIGDWSHTEGVETIASGSYQHVSGQYNTQGDTTSLLIVGNGTGVSRSDAFKVRMSGSIVLPTTSSTAPTWTGTDGEIVPATVGGVHRLYMWMSGAWRSSSFA
jgi:hypothetical protein